MAKWIWFIDGEETPGRGVIMRAKEIGYDPYNDGVAGWDFGAYTLEGAATALRKKGHRVEQWETGE